MKNRRLIFNWKKSPSIPLDFSRNNEFEKEPFEIDEFKPPAPPKKQCKSNALLYLI